MGTLLLIIIYLAFIGLGLPDSLFGTAWPAIYTDYHLPFAYGSFVSVTVCCGTILSSLMSTRLIRRFGTDKVAAFSTLLTAVALLGFAFAPNIWAIMPAQPDDRSDPRTTRSFPAVWVSTESHLRR